MLKDVPRNRDMDASPGIDDSGKMDLHSIVKESAHLPPEVLAAEFSYVHDRILDQQTIATLTDPSSSTTSDSIKRHRQRRTALMPYLDKRLICVCIRLPGVLYTIEINPGTEEVIHWEWQSV